MTYGRARRPYPKSVREQRLASERALNFCLAAADKPPVSFGIPEKRKYTKPDPADTEAPVLAAVGELLAVHPQVLLAVRQNSGALPYNKDGRPIPVFFYKLLRAPEEITISDYWGFLRDSRPFAIECKRPSWREPRTERELKQQAFLQMIEDIGGVSGFVRSADEAQRILTNQVLSEE